MPVAYAFEVALSLAYQSNANLFSFLAVFLDSKRLQDRSINGLVAVIPYILSVPYQFGFISDSIIQFYVLVVCFLYMLFTVFVFCVCFLGFV